MKTFILFFLMMLVALATRQPNIVLIVSDDQGYGDLGFTGNPTVQTPHIDNLIKESVWLEDYHVAPTCSPTRGSLLTGRWANRTGVWHTINGRSMLRTNEITLADHLSAAGYETGIFGKWHLGDNYPYRPEDRGFTHTYYHAAGGIGQTPDVWNNDYFDDLYHKNGKLVQAEGYCTDVFFNEASSFISDCAKAGTPFFAYITTNAPHIPLSVPQHYYDKYKGKKGISNSLAAFFGMISNIDDNVGKLRELLNDLQVTEDTIFIFTSDNGSATGAKYYNAGMKGRKGTEYEGGHRVPFALHWPYYGLTEHRAVKQHTHMVDIVPTLLDFCEVELTQEELARFDGYTLEPLVGDEETSDAEKLNWERRITVSDSQRVKDPIKWKQSSVMSGKWRLINGKELYHVGHDPGQKTNLIQDFPKEAQRLKDFYETLWTELQPTFSQTSEIYLGSPEAPYVSLNAHDWIQQSMPPWNQAAIRRAPEVKNNAKFRGHWAVKAVKAGKYEITISRWPIGSGLKITEGTPAMPFVPGLPSNYSATKGKAVPITEAILKLDGKIVESQPVSKNDTEVSFTVQLTAGSHQLAPYFLFKADKLNGQLGAYFCEVTPAR